MSIAGLRNYVDNFEFSAKTSILYDWRLTVLGVFTYLCILVALRAWVVARRKPYNLKWVVVGHNLLLSAVSLLLLCIGTAEVLRLAGRTSWFELWCDAEARNTRGRIWFMYYSNFLLKWYELIDTMLLVLRAKPLQFLHVYHHAATLVLVWSQMVSQTCQMWITMLINLTVHVVMYFYFALHAMGIRVWWKEWVTIGQLVQFAIVLLSGMAGVALRILGDILGFSWAPLCHGTWSGSFFALAILLSYLLLFYKMYKETYHKEGKQQDADLPFVRPRPHHKATDSGDFDAGKVSTWSSRKQD